MNDLECILDFAASLGCKMLSVGANLERVNDTMYRVCHSYHLHSVSIFSLNSLIIISAKTDDNCTGTRQMSVHSSSNHLEKLNRFNQLSRKVCSETPPPKTLAKMLEEANNIEDSPRPVIICGHLISMSCLCALYGGSLWDIVAVCINTVVLYFLGNYFDKRNLNQIIANTICTWVAATLAILLVHFDIGEDYFIIVITNSIMRIPSISLVNAVRNILCGNEMNGILEFLKVILESLAIVLGAVLGIYMFRGDIFGGNMVQW